MDKLHPLIKKIREKRELKEKLTLEIKQLELNCPHQFNEVKLEESFAFEYTPYCVCKDCGKNIDKLNTEEVISAYKAELEFITDSEISLSRVISFYEKHPKGYNLKDVIDV